MSKKIPKVIIYCHMKHPPYVNGNHVTYGMFMLCVRSNLTPKCVEEVMNHNIYLTKVCEHYLATKEGKKESKGRCQYDVDILGNEQA